MPPLDAIIGLGNPGSRYRNTYHNLGFQAVDALSARFSTEPVSSSGGDLRRIDDTPELYLGKPGRYVNRSGEVVDQWLTSFGWEPDRTLIVYDDLNLDVGQVRLRPSGGAGGHNGLSSILNALGTESIPRFRIGIGPLPSGMDPETLVLSEIHPDDRAVYRKLLEDLPELIRTLSEQPWQRAMSSWNGRDYSGES